jgi:hypothetical protein
MTGSKSHRGTAYLHLLKDKNVQRWFENVARGSKITADVYLRRLGWFCQTYNTTPSKLLKMNDKPRYNLVFDMVTSLENKGHAGSYIHSIVKAVRSWLSFNDPILAVKLKIKIKDSRDSPTLKDERTPTAEELRKVFLASSRSGRVACALMAFSGIRPQVLGNYLGTDGLKLGDFPELTIEGNKIQFTNMPTVIRIRRELSKGGHSYITYIGEEGCEYIVSYLKERVKSGEVLTKDSPLITPLKWKKEFITTGNISSSIRDGIRIAGFSWRPYVLRAYFDTQLMLAESKGLILRDYRSFWMGHSGDIENRYTTNKGRLPEQVQDDMRSAYAKAQDMLQTKTPAGPSTDEVKAMFANMGLTVAGYTEEQLKEIDMNKLSLDEVADLMKKKLTPAQNGNHQKVVLVEEAEKLIAEGWTYISTLPNQKIVVKAPHIDSANQ